MGLQPPAFGVAAFGGGAWSPPSLPPSSSELPASLAAVPPLPVARAGAVAAAGRATVSILIGVGVGTLSGAGPAGVGFCSAAPARTCGEWARRQAQWRGRCRAEQGWAVVVVVVCVWLVWVGW